MRGQAPAHKALLSKLQAVLHLHSPRSPQLRRQHGQYRIKHYSTSSASPCSQQPRRRHKRRQQHQQYLQRRHRRYHKPCQRSQRKRLYQYRQLPPLPLIYGACSTHGSKAAMEVMETKLQTTLCVTGRAARNNNPGHFSI